MDKSIRQSEGGVYTCMEDMINTPSLNKTTLY